MFLTCSTFLCRSCSPALLFVLMCASISASSKEVSTLQKIKRATKDVLPYTIGGFAISLAHEYRIASRNKEFPRLNRKRVGRAMATTIPPTFLAVYIAYKYEQLRRQLKD